MAASEEEKWSQCQRRTRRSSGSGRWTWSARAAPSPRSRNCSGSPSRACTAGKCPARLYTAILRHIVLVMAALAICAVTAAMLRDRTDTQAAPPARPGDAPPADPGLIPLTVREIRRLLPEALSHPKPPGHAARWLEWRRRHQARSRWFHKTRTLGTQLRPGQLATGCCRPSYQRAF